MARKPDIKKVVLAYSGGLDTSVIIPWLKENYNGCEVIAVSADVGQGAELEGLEEKAVRTGASKLYIEDLKEEFITDFIYPTLKAGAVYEGQYLLGTSFARPIIAKRIVEIALKEKADAICHGCTGKGNDQVRFELAIKAFAPDMAIIAPWREWELKSREDEIDYAEARGIPLKINRETNYSKDKNLWHLSHEGMDLENPQNEPQYQKPGFLEMCLSPEQAPDRATYVKISFEERRPRGGGRRADGPCAADREAEPAGRRQRRGNRGHGGKPPRRHEEPRRVRDPRRHHPLPRARGAGDAVPRPRHPALQGRSSPPALPSSCISAIGSRRCARRCRPSWTRRRNSSPATSR